MRCAVCKNNDWMELPNPHPDHSLRSDCRIIQEPLNKRQCAVCGLVQRESFGIEAELYGSDYSLYDNLHGAEEFDNARRKALAVSIATLLPDVALENILEIGAGSGATLTEMKKIFPKAELYGIEPAAAAIEIARKSGIPVLRGMVGENEFPEFRGKFAIIYSIQVIEHVAYPLNFIRGSARMLRPGGMLVIRCPDGAHPHSELLFNDHNYSFLARHITFLLHEAGLKTLHFGPCSAGAGKEYGLVILASKTEEKMLEPAGKFPYAENTRHYQERSEYLKKITGLGEELRKRIGDRKKILCFGAAQWAGIIACYAPKIWDAVSACIIDNPAAGTFFKKPIMDYGYIKEYNPGAVLLGISPASQNFIKARLERDGVPVISWNDLINC